MSSDAHCARIYQCPRSSRSSRDQTSELGRSCVLSHPPAHAQADEQPAGDLGNPPARRRARLCAGRQRAWCSPRDIAASQPNPDLGSRGLRLLAFAPTDACDRSSVDHELALRPGFSAQTRMPPTVRPAPRGERPGLLGFACGAGALLSTASTHRPGDRALSARPLGSSRPLPFPRGPTQGDGKAYSMTPKKQDTAAGRRGELHRERGSRRLLPANDDQRSLNARRARDSRIKARLDPSARRYTYLTQPHD